MHICATLRVSAWESRYFVELDLDSGVFKGKNDENFYMKSIERIFDYYQSELELHVESIKYELDSVHLDSTKRLKRFKSFLKSNRNDFKKYEQLIRHKKIFELSNKQIIQSNIGLLHSSFYVDINRFNQISDANKIVKLNTRLTSMNGICELGSTNILLTDSNFNRLVLINSNTHIIEQQIDQIENMRFNYPIGVCTDHVSNLYVCNKFSSNIYILNMQLTKLKKVVGGKGQASSEFSCPEDILFADKNLYVLDTGNRRIQTFTRNGNFRHQYPLFKNAHNELLEYPIRFALHQTTFAVCDKYEDIYLYDMLGDRCLEMKRVIQSNKIDRVMCFIHNYLVVCNNIGSIVCYDINELDKFLFESQRISNLIGIISFMGYFNKHLYVTFTNKRYLVVI